MKKWKTTTVYPSLATDLMAVTQKHRTTEWVGLEGTLKVCLIPTPLAQAGNLLLSFNSNYLNTSVPVSPHETTSAISR